MSKKHGKLIVIEGTDGSGKGTQTKLIVDRLKKEGVKVEVLDFPQYESPSSFFVQKYLRGEYGTADEVGARRASMFYALDRYDKSFEVKKWLAEGTTVISNRYVSASMGHQTGKIKGRAKQDAFLKWLSHLEYEEMGIPKPDATIFLYMPADVAQTLIDKKAARAYIKGKKRDIHEADIAHLRNASKAYLYVAKKYKWHTIGCYKNDAILSIEDIHEKIYSIVKKV